MTAARRIGGFEVVRELGRGGMGVVFEVRDPALPDRRLALKLILGQSDAETLARFGREVELLARVRHRNVVAIHTVARAPEGPYVVMDLVDGESLSTRAARGMSPREAATVVMELCDAVAALHAAGIIHRDLKPANVIVRQDGAPVLLDFGVARAASGASLTRTGEIVGSPRYMAPEQAQGKGAAPMDERTDVYGLGAILFELLAGTPPFAELGGTAFNVLYAVVERDPPWPDDRPAPPAALAVICRRAMAKAPADRFQSATDLRAALEQALAAGELAPGRRARSGLRGVGVLAGLVALAAVAYGATRDTALSPRPAPDVAAATSIAPLPPPPPAPVTERAPAEVRPTSLSRRWTLPHAPGDARGVWLGPERVVTVGGGELALWDLSGPEPRRRKVTPTGYPVGRAVVARDRLLVSGAGLQAFTLDGLEPIPDQHDVHYDGQWTVDGLAVTKDGRWVAYGYEAGIGVLHVGRADRLGVMLEPLWSSSRIRAVAFSPRGDRLVCASETRDPRVVSLWELGADGVPISDRRDQSVMSAGLALAFSPDGEDLVVGTSGGTILRLPPDGTEVVGADPDVTGKRILSALELGGLLRPASAAGEVDARDVAFSADGALLFTLIGDDESSTLEVWKRSGWTRLVEGLRIPRRTRQLAPAPDGRWLLVGALGGVEVWDVPEPLRRGEPLPR